MSEATKQIIEELSKGLADLDAKMLSNQIEWAKGRVAAVKAYKNDPAHRNGNMRLIDSHKYYDGLFRVAGGKTWLHVFEGRTEQMINNFIAKNCKMIADNRNSKIARKLEKEGIAKITDSAVQQSSDGYHGFFKVETANGGKTIEIDTIYAGGYNIQCFHQRTLVKIK